MCSRIEHGASEVEDVGRQERIRRRSSSIEQYVTFDKMDKDTMIRRERLRGKRSSERRSRKQRSSRQQSSGSDDRDEYERRRWKTRTRTGQRRRHVSSSSGSDMGSPQLPRKVERGKEDDGSDTKVLVDKFLNILDKIKGSDKPKLTFNTNVIPEFDPMAKEQTILTWLTKVEE
ncbi:uncharacterized protein LOC134199848 [Bombyx mori]|uniref:Uncharacterized protein n=1 Tax=Bombyx mori TaxID=7091 RepID=A0A8R2R508_BOMMO|nr:uncharacterized protein LOC119630871 [Bombyx mori]